MIQQLQEEQAAEGLEKVESGDGGKWQTREDTDSRHEETLRHRLTPLPPASRTLCFCVLQRINYPTLSPERAVT